MSRYNNEFDEDDDGEELEITDEEEAASDDEGREAAAMLMAHCESVVGNRKVHEDQRRMWFRLAKKALAEGVERREAAEAKEEARREADRREREARIAREEEERHDREMVEREERRAEIRWRNAEAARIEAETARVRVARPAASGPVAQRSTVPPAPTAARPSFASPAPMRPRVSAAARARGPVVAVPPSARGMPTPTAPIRPTVPEHAVRVAAPAVPPPSRLAQQSASGVRLAQAPAARPPSPAIRVEAPPVAAPEGGRPLTGDDLMRWRTARGITQRAAAVALGVAPSTVAKAELVPSKQLGEQLQVTLRTALGQ